MLMRLGEEEDVHTLAGGVASALTTKETLLDEDGWSDLPPRICLAASAEAVIDEEETKAAAILLLGRL